MAINLDKYRRKSNPKLVARIAFKKKKNGFPITSQEEYLIKKYYPFMR